MKLEALQSAWDEAGKTDPLWSVLSDPAKKGNKWTVDEFLETGRKEIDELMRYVLSLGVLPPTRRALDFGCGPGRLTQALATHFERVDGVDISPSMIELANTLNRHPDRCRYYLNDRDDLKEFADGTYDLVYSAITLQHIEPPYASRYLKELFRILALQGVLIFQIPSHQTGTLRRFKRVAPASLLAAYHRIRHGGHPVAAVYGMPREAVQRFCRENGATIIDIQVNNVVGNGWESFRYCCRRDSRASGS
jgi:SAM-dependent methyltransferase